MGALGIVGRVLKGIPTFKYSIARELLWGEIDGKAFACAAKSGGGRGSVNPAVPQKTLSSFNPHRLTQGSTRGGALPPGWWWIETPVESGDSMGPWVSRLTPDDATRQAYARDYDHKPFKIHGTGPGGSDGCLVIEQVHRIVLLSAVKASPTQRGRLHVLWEGEKMNELLDRSNRYV